MGEHDKKKQPETKLPEEERGPEREAGDRPAPVPGHVGNLPDKPTPIGNPLEQ